MRLEIPICVSSISISICIVVTKVYEHIRGGNALSDLACVDSIEERKNRWLAQRMQEMLWVFDSCAFQNSQLFGMFQIQALLNL